MRVRVLLRKGSRQVETAALLNTGFESEEPDIVLPSRLAEELSLRGEAGDLIRLDTAGGPLECVFIERGLDLELLLADREGPRIACNVIISPHEKEVLLSDKVIEELGIQIMSARSGRWRLKDDPPGLERPSAEPTYWL